jgi:hypothetical protein
MTLRRPPNYYPLSVRLIMKFTSIPPYFPHVFNNTYTFTLRARDEWMVETQKDRLFPLKCEYEVTGEGAWDSVTKTMTQ